MDKAEDAAEPVTAPVDNPVDNYKLRLADNDTRTIPDVLVPPYAYGFDCAAGRVTDYHKFHDELPLVMLKASFSNVIEAFVLEYNMNLSLLMQSAEETCKKLGMKNPLTHDYIRALKSGAYERLDEGLRRLMSWDGVGELMVQLPYCLLAQSGDKDNSAINFRQSNPRVNGVIWVASYRHAALDVDK